MTSTRSTPSPIRFSSIPHSSSAGVKAAIQLESGPRRAPTLETMVIPSYGVQRLTQQVVGDPRAVVGGGVEVVDAELAGAAQDGDRLVVVGWRAEDVGPGQLHRAVADAVDVVSGEGVAMGHGPHAALASAVQPGARCNMGVAPPPDAPRRAERLPALAPRAHHAGRRRSARRRQPAPHARPAPRGARRPRRRRRVLVHVARAGARHQGLAPGARRDRARPAPRRRRARHVVRARPRGAAAPGRQRRAGALRRADRARRRPAPASRLPARPADPRAGHQPRRRGRARRLRSPAARAPLDALPLVRRHAPGAARPSTWESTGRSIVARFRAEHARHAGEPEYEDAGRAAALPQRRVRASGGTRTTSPTASAAPRRSSTRSSGTLHFCHAQTIPTGAPDLRLTVYAPADEATRAILAAL